MRRADALITDFSAGELSRKFDGRVDLSIYKKGCAELENFLVTGEGGATFRPGTRYAASVKTAADSTRLIPFVVSASEVYLLEFGDEYFRVYVGSTHARSGTVEVTTPYTSAQVFDLKFVQIENDLIIVHPSHQPRKVTYTSATSWAITAITFTGVTFSTADNYPRAVAYFQERLWLAGSNTNPSTIWVSVSGDYTDFTTSGPPIIATDYFEFDVVADKKRTILWMETYERGIAVGTILGEGIIYPLDSGISAAGGLPNFRWLTTYGSEDIQGSLSGNTLFYVQQGNKTVRDFSGKDMTVKSDHLFKTYGVVDFAYSLTPYPSVWFVREDGQIAVLALDKEMGVAAWSRIVTDGEFESVAVVPNDGKDELWFIVKREIDDSDVRYIEYLDDFETVDQEDCHFVDCGTFLDNETDNVSALTAETVKDITAITQANPAVVTCAAHGYSNGDTVRLGEIGGMVELNGSEYTVAGATTDTFQLSGIDSSTYAEYTSGGKVVKTPNLAVTMTTALATLGWSNDDYVEFNDLEGMTELNTRRFKIEGVSAATFDVDTLDVQDYTAYTSGGTAMKVVNTVTGLDELEDESVAILADGGVHANKTVASGEITLNGYYNRIHVGMPYTGTLKTMRVEGGGLLKKKRINKLRMRFYKTLGVKFGPDEDNLKTVIFRTGSDPMGSPPDLYTGDKEEHFPGNWSTENYIVLTHEDPTPMTIVALGADMVIGG